ncbi:MAG: response regulator, partial [Candidatus Jacksonbacteria bacterium]
DDELSFLQMYGLKLGRAGFEVQICQNSRDSLKKIREFKPDIVFLDLVMSGQDGLQILKKLKSMRETKWLPVVMLTNIDNQADREECAKFGASHYLIKLNVSPAQLAEYAKAVLREI